MEADVELRYNVVPLTTDSANLMNDEICKQHMPNFTYVYAYSVLLLSQRRQHF